MIIKPQQEDISVEFHRTGGFAGFDDMLTVEQGGAASLKSSMHGDVEFTLTEAQWTGLVNLIKETDFSTLESSYDPSSGVADFFSYALMVQVGGEEAEVMWVDGWASENPVPGELTALQEYLLDIIDGLAS